MTSTYPTVINGRHDIKLVLKLEPLGNDYQQEWLRDAGFPIRNDRYLDKGSGRNRTGDKSLWASMEEAFPLMHIRFPTDPQYDPTTASTSTSVPIALKRLDPTLGGGKGESFRESSKSSTDAYLRARVRGNAKRKFHPDFLVVETDPRLPSEDRDQRYVSCLQRGLTFLDTPESQQMRTDFTQATRSITERDTMTLEDIKTLRFCEWINAILGHMLGPAYTPHKLFHRKGTCPPGDSTVNRRAYPWATKGLLVLKQGRNDLIDYLMDDAAAGGEVKVDQSRDMSSEHLLDQNLKTHAEVTSINPIASAVRSLTLCKSRLRLWQTTPLSLNSSRLIDVECKEHHKDLLKVLLFLASPLECVLPSWQPPSAFPLYDVVSQAGQVRSPYTWHSTGRLLYARAGPCGNHTSIWQGELERDGSLSPGCFKGSMLPLGLVEHEYRMLELFRGSAGKIFPDVDARTCQRLDLLKSTPELEGTLELIPQVVGMMPHSHPDTMDPVYRSETRTQPAASLYLAALVFKGPPELSLSSEPTSILQTIRIFADAVRVLWYSSCLGIDYRDINLGNIMKRLVNDGTIGGSYYRGVLIDFGNAIYGRLPRDPGRDRAADLRDDGRSTNIYFMTLNTIAGITIVDDLDQSQAEIHRLEQRLANADSDYEKLDLVDLLKDARAQFNEASEALRSHRLHGYTDNLESLLYCFVTQLDRLINGSTVCSNELGDPVLKRKHWGRMRDLVKRICPNSTQIPSLVGRLRDTIQGCRDKVINTGLASIGPKPRLTDEEHGCFRDFLGLFTSTLRRLENTDSEEM